jgi:hypothetical protein
VDISRTEHWVHPVMPMDATWRPMHALTIARHYAIAFGIAIRPTVERTVPIVLRTLVWIAVLAVIAFIVWVLQADGSANGLQAASPWGPDSGVLHSSGK